MEELQITSNGGGTAVNSQSTNIKQNRKFVPLPKGTPDTAPETLAPRATKESPVNQRTETARADAFARTQFRQEGVDSRTRVNMGAEAPTHGAVFIPADQDLENLDPDLLLCRNKAQLVFSTHAMSGYGLDRQIGLKKKDKGEEDVGVDRQEQLNKEFMKVKHILGLGQKGNVYKKVAINYSITWHFIEMKIDGKIERFDLLDKRDIKKVLEMRGTHPDDKYVDDVYKKLLSMNRVMRRVTKEETGSSAAGVFVHDYVGNPKGPELFHPQTVQTDKVMRRDQSHGKYLKTMEVMEHVTRTTGNLFKRDKLQLTASGAKALNEMDDARALQKKIVDKLTDEKKKLEVQLKALSTPPHKVSSEELKKQVNVINGKISEIDKVLQEIENANKTVIDFTLLELNRKHEHRENTYDTTGQLVSDVKTLSGHDLLKPLNSPLSRNNAGIKGNDTKGAKRQMFERRDRLANDATQDFETILKEQNRTRPHFWSKKQNHTLGNHDKQMAREVGQVVHQLSGGSRLEVIEAAQRGGTHVFREPRAEKLILTTILSDDTPIDKSALGSYRGSETSAEVQKVMVDAINDYKQALKKGSLQAGDDYFTAVKTLV